MSQAIHVTGGNHAGPRSQRGAEQYATAPCAVEALLAVEPLPPRLLEPCAGDGAIVRVLEAHGHIVTAYDLVHDGIDFLKVTKAPPDVGAIVTNPPFSRAADFVRRGLLLVPKVVVLERIQWLEAECRADIFDSGKLARVYVFRDRVPRMHRIGWIGRRSSPAMCLAWFVFECDHVAAPTLHWLNAGREAPGDPENLGPDAASYSAEPDVCPANRSYGARTCPAMARPRMNFKSTLSLRRPA